MTTSNRTRAAFAGGSFLAAILVYATGSALAAGSIPGPGSLDAISANVSLHASGTILMLLNSVLVTGIGILLFPVIRRYHSQAALLYLGARLAEALLLLVGVIFLLLLVPLSHDASGTTATERPVYETLHRLMLQGNYWSYQVAMMILGLGSIPLCAVLYRHRLIPRFAAAWGLAGYALLVAGSVMEFYGLRLGIVLSVPGGLFEVFLGIWLLAKGLEQRLPWQPVKALS